ncbi:MAG TPA: FAD:protein FMN transferase [Methylomirabilota bacterium]|nr:FAD:protein FMN transferase [Methylomirabilota bacterium]
MAAFAELQFTALGGQCELFAAGAGDLAGARAWLDQMHDRLTRFSPDSELARLNAAAGRWIDASPELEALLRQSLVAYAMSGGLVHVGVLPALLAAGYTRDFAAGPTAASGDAIVAPPLPEMLEVDGHRARLRPGTSIDLGGIAKGWLADRAVERIGPNALANLAGDLRARGAGPAGEGWPAGFGTTTVLLRDIGAATSGTEGRRWGPRLHHLIDPRTGRPAETDLVEVSVLAPTGAEAEVLAKTALLLGRTEGARFLDAHSLGSYLT